MADLHHHGIRYLMLYVFCIVSIHITGVGNVKQTAITQRNSSILGILSNCYQTVILFYSMYIYIYINFTHCKTAPVSTLFIRNLCGRHALLRIWNSALSLSEILGGNCSAEHSTNLARVQRYTGWPGSCNGGKAFLQPSPLFNSQSNEV